MPAQFDVKDYSLLDDAAALNQKMVSSIENLVDAMMELDVTIGDTTIFEGPIADDAYKVMKAFKTSFTEAETLFKNLGTALTNTNDIYQNADRAASGTVAGAGGGNVTAQIM